jgi:hypothetical protein
MSPTTSLPFAGSIYSGSSRPSTSNSSKSSLSRS